MNRSCLLQGLLVQAQHPPNAAICLLGSVWLVSSLCCISALSFLTPQFLEQEGQEMGSFMDSVGDLRGSVRKSSFGYTGKHSKLSVLAVAGLRALS